MSENPPPPSYNEVAPPGQAPPGQAPPIGFTQGAPQGAPAQAPPQDDGRWVLSYQDFIPAQLTPGGIFSAGTYEPFS